MAWERVTETAKPVVPSLLETDFRKSGVEMATENVGLARRLPLRCEYSPLAVADELNQQLRQSEVYTLSVFRLEES